MIRRRPLLPIIFPSALAVATSSVSFLGLAAPSLHTAAPAAHSKSMGEPAWVREKKQAMLKKRELRALERAGIDTSQDDEDEFVSPEEQARIDAEKAEAERLRREREDEIRERRDKEDEDKKAKWKKWRASQIKSSATRKKEARAHHHTHDQTGGMRQIAVEAPEEVADDAAATATATATAEAAKTTDAADAGAAETGNDFTATAEGEEKK